MSKRLSLMLVILLVLFLSVGSVSCTPAKKPGPSQPTPGTSATNELHQRAVNIADRAAEIKGVKKATAIISDTTAYVGLDLDASIQGTNTNAVKNQVVNRVKAADPRLRAVMVTTDADTVTRIKNVARGVEQGKPISSFGREIEEIGRRLKPSGRL